jgi:hypothetical protein
MVPLYSINVWKQPGRQHSPQRQRVDQFLAAGAIFDRLWRWVSLNPISAQSRNR